MRYTVVWLPGAEATLTNLWLNASDRQAVTDASNCIDLALANDPDTKGQPQGSFLSLEIAPLAVLYEVDPGDRMVRVITVKRT
jgi:hypothetical protein